MYSIYKNKRPVFISKPVFYQTVLWWLRRLIILYIIHVSMSSVENYWLNNCYLTGLILFRYKSVYQSTMKTTLIIQCLILIFENLIELDALKWIIFQFDPGIKVNVDSCHDGKETVLGIVSDLHLVKMIIVKDTVVDSFGGSPVLVDLVPFIGSVS